jgi:tetratricopeptide (TPR) repeat protein
MRKTFALCLVLMAVVAMNAFALGEARFEGKVIDAATKAGVPGASILVVSTGARNFKAEFKTDKDGNFRFLLIDGTLTYKFTVSAKGLGSYEESIKPKLGETNHRDFVLGGPTEAAPGAPAAAAKADPSVAAYNEGATLANEGKNAEAIAKFEEAVTAKPDLTAGYQALAKLYVRTKQWDKAIDRANKSLAIDADDIDMNSVLFEAYTATSQAAKAAEAKKKLPANASALFNDAAKLINSGKDADAEPLLKQAITVDDKFAQAYYELGMIYVRTQKNADAKVNLQKYLELAPDGKDAATAKEMLKYVK